MKPEYVQCKCCRKHCHRDLDRCPWCNSVMPTRFWSIFNWVAVITGTLSVLAMAWRFWS